MKKILIGLLALGSLSSFANDCDLNLNGVKVKKSTLKLLKQKYNISNSSNTRFTYDQSGQCMGIDINEKTNCEGMVVIKEASGYVYDQATGSEDVGDIRLYTTLSTKGIFGRVGDRAIKEAVSNLRGCL